MSLDTVRACIHIKEIAMQAARDIFTFNFMGREPSLKDLLVGLPLDVRSALLGGAKTTVVKDIDASIQRLSASRKKEVQREANLILNGSRVDKEELEELSKSNDILVAKNDSSYTIVHRLLTKLGYEDTERVLTALLSVTNIDRVGTFAEFDAPRLDPTEANFLEWINQIEVYLESQLSKGAKDTRQVKVRMEWAGKDIVVGIYYQRPDIDGKDVQKVSKTKRVVPKLFKQSAGISYFVIKPGKKRSRIVIKSPTLKLAKHIRIAVGQSLWKDTNAVSAVPAIAYNLSVFKDPSFELSLAVDDYDIDKIVVSELCIRALTGTTISLKTDGRGKDADALNDFREISQGARVLVEESTVESVLVKFLPRKDRRRVLAKAKIYPNKIELEEENWDLINTHLKAWRIIGE